MGSAEVSLASAGLSLLEGAKTKTQIRTLMIVVGWPVFHVEHLGNNNLPCGAAAGNARPNYPRGWHAELMPRADQGAIGPRQK